MKPMRFVPALLVVCAVSTSCGLPDSGPPRQIDPSQVPYHLLGTATAAPSTKGQPLRTTTPRLYLLTSSNRLRAVEAPLAPSGLPQVLPALLAQLAQGPDEAQRASGLATALGPGVALSLIRVRERTAVVQLDLGEQGPAANRLPLAIGQVVLTATSVRGVDRVKLVRADGKAIEVPLPDGALTAEPVQADDYASLVTTSPMSSTSTGQASRSQPQPGVGSPPDRRATSGSSGEPVRS